MVGDQWLSGAQDAIKLMREKGHKVCIHSCNNPGWIEKCLNEAGIVVDMIWEKKHGSKPLADLYVDDRGYHFRGDWPTTIHNVLARVDGLDNRKDKDWNNL